MTGTTETHRSLIESVGHAKHSLQSMHDPGSASVTVHGVCPDPACGALTVTQVHADTNRVACGTCGKEFAV